MQTLLLLFLTSSYSSIILIYIFFKSKQSRLNELLNGRFALVAMREKKVFFDTNTNAEFSTRVINNKSFKRLWMFRSKRG